MSTNLEDGYCGSMCLLSAAHGIFGNLKTWNKDGKVMGSVWVTHSSITPPEIPFEFNVYVFWYITTPPPLPPHTFDSSHV